MNGTTRRTVLFLMLAIVLAYLFAVRVGNEPLVTEIPYSVFQQKLAAGQVDSVVVSDAVIRGKLKQPLPDGTAEFTTVRVDPQLAAALAERQVTYSGRVQPSGFSGLFFWLLLTVALFGFWIWVFRRMAGRGGMGQVLTFGKSHAKVYAEQNTQVTFADVAGVDEAKAELQEVVNFLRSPESYSRLGAHVPKGVLLVGPPGTGKTLLARAVAGEAGVPFFSINGSEFVEMFVGVGAARVRDLFDQARLQAPCIVFIDELDALGRARGVLGTGGSDEKEQTLNQLLAEIDGFSPDSRVILLAATNRPEILDPALLRAGRFDRQVLVDRPDRIGRTAILRVHLKKIKTDPRLGVEQVAALTPGFTGADLANLVNEAALVATRRDAPAVALADFDEALERIVAGLAKKSRVLSARERTVVAYHEMGHALVAMALPGVEQVEKVSIIPRGIAGLGYTIQRPTEDRYLLTRSELEARLTVLLGGRAAESLIYQELSTGAADDLERATELARDMVMRFGMDGTVGHVVYGGPRSAFLTTGPGESTEMRRYSEATAREIECAVRQLVEAAFARASAILQRNREALERGASLLLERETLSREELPQVSSAERVTAPAVPRLPPRHPVPPEAAPLVRS